MEDAASTPTPLVPHDAATVPHHGAAGGARGVRGRLRAALSSTRFHVLIVVLVVADLALTVANLGLTLSHCELRVSDSVSRALSGLTQASIAILSLMCLEFLASAFAFGSAWLCSMWHALDVVVVAASLAADSIEVRAGFADGSGEAVEELVALVVLFRLWRLARVMRALVEVDHEVTGRSQRPGSMRVVTAKPATLSAWSRARRWTRRVMRSRAFHVGVVTVVLADLALTCTSLGITVAHCHVEPPAGVERAIKAMSLASVAILVSVCPTLSLSRSPSPPRAVPAIDGERAIMTLSNSRNVPLMV
jgi:hypothetical protein